MTAGVTPSDLLDDRLPDALVAQYRRDGYVRVRGMLQGAELEHFQEASLRFLTAHRAESRTSGSASEKTFTQLVNVWNRDAALADLVMHPRLAHAAEQLSGTPLRIWHDQMLVKEPHNSAPTQFHQDRPYWPHAQSSGPSLSVWVALVDVPVERGCMTFLPGTQHLASHDPQNLNDEESLFQVYPDLRWHERVTLPLRAGDCTFHNSFTGHMANANSTDQPRIAQVIAYMDADTVYTGQKHVLTDEQDLVPGQVLDTELFPRPWA